MDKSLIIRIGALLFTLINLILTMCGANPIPVADELVYEIFSIVVTIVAAGWNAWKNNNFTAAAKLVQKLLDAIKKGKISVAKIEEFLNACDDKPV